MQPPSADTAFVRRPSRWLRLGLLAVLLAVAAWWVGGKRSQAVDGEMRERQLAQASGIARTINPDSIKELHFTLADRTNPAFLQIREQMMAYGKALGLRSLYSEAMKAGTILFGPENLDEGSPMASPPGTV